MIFALTLIGAVVYLGYLILQEILMQENIIVKAFGMSLFVCAVSGVICFGFFGVVMWLDDLFEKRELKQARNESEGKNE